MYNEPEKIKLGDTEYEILSIFTLPQTQKYYVEYTDNEYVDGELNDYIATFDPNKEDEPIKEIESDSEWAMVLEFVKNRGGSNEWNNSTNITYFAKYFF